MRCELSERDLEQIPTHGPVVIVANHPLGALDGGAAGGGIAGAARRENRCQPHADDAGAHQQPDAAGG